VALNALISVKNLVDILESPNLLVFDCRFDLANTQKGEQLYAQSHIPGAYYAHLDEHLSSPITPDSGRHPMPDLDQLQQWLGQCGMAPSKQVVVYDDSYGAMATRLWWLLKCLGHEQVAVLDGGWQAWQRAAGVETSVIPAAVSGSCSQAFSSDCVVTTRQIVENLNVKEFDLVDVRTEERFKGIKEPIDPIAGHVPGAVNIPLALNLDEDGLYKSPAELTALYSPILQSGRSGAPAFMCGSGVTACHSVLAMVVAGFDQPRVYAGSWSEWIRDADRPVATDF
jgi:thiosulfate/3-mercaptopyruvate sulfurtransferase